jgi:hypothetical protein
MSYESDSSIGGQTGNDRADDMKEDLVSRLAKTGLSIREAEALLSKHVAHLEMQIEALRVKPIFTRNGQTPDWLFPRKVASLNPYLPPQIMKGLLYQGCRFVFGGSPKAKKSWLLMLCCYCVANGLPFLVIPTTKGKVVYINFELLEGECRQRFHEIQKAMGTGSLDDIEVIQLRDKQLSDINLEQLQAIISEASFVLCSFDPIYKLLDGRDERLGIDIAPVLASLGSISEKAKCSVGFSQHFTKGNQSQKFAIDRISGSNYFTRDADVILVMTNLNEPDCYGIEIIQRSFPEIKPFGIRWQCPIFVRDDSIDAGDIQQPGKEKKTDPIAERILAVLHAANFEGGLSFTDLLRAIQVKGVNGKPTPAKATFCRKLGEMTNRNEVEKSVATEKYMLTAKYAEKRTAFVGGNGT